MNEKVGTPIGRPALTAVMVLLLALVLGIGSAWADTQYFFNGAAQDASNGGWVMPNQGSCFPNSSLTTRPECLALRFNFASEAACVQASGQNPPQVYSWSTSVCNDTVNTTQALCEAQPGRMWNDWGGGTGVCAVTMRGNNRNRGSCESLGGTWVNSVGTCTGTWTMPDATTYNPPLSSGSYTGSYVTGTSTKKSLPYPSNPGPGEQCTRCHNDKTEWNAAKVRWVADTFVKTSHQNASRPVTAGKPWAGPYGIYPTDSKGNAIDWTAGTVTIGGTPKSLYWIHDGWLEAPFLPVAIYNTAPVSGKPGVSYSCARCHTTGWTSDATLKSTKLPEKTWLGITWDGVTPPVNGQVNLAGGAAADTRTMASWDQWGIVCSRCHGTAAENLTGKCDLTAVRTSANCATTNPKGSWWEGQCLATLIESTCTAAGGTWSPGPPYGGAYIYGGSNPSSAMSTHHSNLTSPDAGSGYCTDSRFLTSTGCTDAANYWPNASVPGVPVGTWVTPCSDGVSATQQACLTAGKTWLVSYCSVQANSYCSTSTYTAATCATNGGTWGIPPTGGMSSVCMLPMFTTPQACAAHVGWKDGQAVSTAWNSQYSGLEACEDIGGEWTGSKTQRGPIITGLCMNCHRQESAGYPYDYGTCSNPLYTDPGNCFKNGGTWTYTGGGLPMKVGPFHNSVEFATHFQPTQLLNSPHGQFTGMFSTITTSKYGAGYASKFQLDGETIGTGNGCTGCHNVHKSIVGAANPAGGGVEECQECHSNPADAYAPQIDLSTINHLSGPGTPLENIATDPASACIICHMPGGSHMFRNNTDPSYSTFPASVYGMTSGVTDANTAPEGTYTQAVWNDLDATCGQCHGGGSAYASTTGSINAGSKTLTVASATGLATGVRVKIAGAASSGGQPVDFNTYVASVSGTTVTLVGAAGTTVTNVAVTANPTKNGAPYYTKAQIALVAEGIHDYAGVTYQVTFSASVNGYDVTTTAVVNCGGVCPPLTYEWNWGDGTYGSGNPGTHTYAAAGFWTIKLKVRRQSDNKIVGQYQRRVLVTAPDYPPNVDGTVTFDANTWVATLTDASTDTDDTPISFIMVEWGDGTAKSYGSQNSKIVHTYNAAGTFNIKQTAVDTKQQASSKWYMGAANPAYFTIAGTVTSKIGVPLASATVQVKKGTSVIQTVYTASNGTFSAGSLKPATNYSLTVVKYGYTFTNPAWTGALGPSQTGLVIAATAP